MSEFDPTVQACNIAARSAALIATLEALAAHPADNDLVAMALRQTGALRARLDLIGRGLLAQIFDAESAKVRA